MLRFFRSLLALNFLFVLAAGAAAQLGDDIARRHAERAGPRLQQLQALRGEGKTFIGRDVVPFEFIQVRPNKLRVESYAPLRRVVQAYDGVNPPWVSHSEVKAGVPQTMPPADAKEFLENADFDGPLVNYAEKGYSVDYAGEEKVEGRDAYKLLLMGKNESILFEWIDTKTFELVKRTVFKVSKGKRVTLDTLFKDFRPVGGVMQPHRVESLADGQLVYVMVLDKLEANPRNIPPETFTRPEPRP